MSTLFVEPTTSGGKVMSNSIVAPTSRFALAWMYTPAALTFRVKAFSFLELRLLRIVIGSERGNRLPVRRASDKVVNPQNQNDCWILRLYTMKSAVSEALKVEEPTCKCLTPNKACAPQ
jgi:hypothetical protein